MGERVINGLAGFEEVEDTDARVANTDRGEYWENIVILTDAKFAVFTAGNVTGFGADADVGTARVYLAGDSIFAKITSFTLHSGRVRAYRRSN